MRSGNCRECANNYYFKDTTDDAKCHRFKTIAETVVEGCGKWGHHLDTDIEYCIRCKPQYFGDHEGATCTQFTPDKSCGAYCETCYVKEGLKITADGENTVCLYCEKSYGIS